jgi:hypothetical protein
MCTVVGRLRDELQAIVAALAPDVVEPSQAPGLWQTFDAVERLAAAAKVLLARRVEESRAWDRAGYRSAAEYLAVRGGASVGEARRALETSQRLGSAPATEAALRQGDLSGAQAAHVVEAATASPGAQARLVRSAATMTLRELSTECARVKAAADRDPDASHRRIHTSRRLRCFRDAEGGWNLSARGTPEAGARLNAALAPIVDELFKRARTSGEHEPRDAYAFDALIELAARAGRGETGREARVRAKANPNYLALLRVDVEALRRGAVEGDERCEITGIGPVPARVARELLGDAVLKLVVTRGVDVANVTHLGRGPSAAQRVALLWSSPTCTVEGCDAVRVEVDHRVPWAETHHTRLDECDALCASHHRRKTNDGWALVAGTGKRPMVPPDDPRHPANATRGSP